MRQCGVVKIYPLVLAIFIAAVCASCEPFSPQSLMSDMRKRVGIKDEAEVEEEAPVEKKPVIVKAKAPIPADNIKKLMEDCPVVLDVQCVAVTDLEGWPQTKQDKLGTTVFSERVVIFKVVKAVKGVFDQTEIELRDRDFSVSTEESEVGFFYVSLDSAQTPLRYALFLDKSTLPDCERIGVVRYPVKYRQGEKIPKRERKKKPKDDFDLKPVPYRSGRKLW